jgi:hypothetical protein
LQEVALGYNSQNLKNRVLKNYETLLSSQSVEFIENIQHSIFLRYLPLPLIMTIGSQREGEDFITILQSEEYEKSTLIWKKDMTNILKEEILLNC